MDGKSSMGDSGSLPATMLVVGEEVRIDEDYNNEFKMHTRNFINELPRRMQGIDNGRVVRTTQPNSKTICAFLNSDGGSIYLGISDSGHVVGLRMTQSLIDHFYFSLYECLKRFTPKVPTELIKVALLPVKDTDDGTLDHLKTEQDEDHLSDDEFINQFNSNAQTKCHTIGLPYCSCENSLKLEHSDLYVIVIKVSKGAPGVVYQNEEGLAYYRR
ncbi:hypothetical protein WR25_27259 isoform C [Diploscapter pachys]|nr:hypothetical protein WR25_27259 isoform C [Diploscapter pachys]